MKANIALGAALVALLVAVASTVAPPVADRLSSPACVVPQTFFGAEFQGISDAVDAWAKAKVLSEKSSPDAKIQASVSILGGSFNGISIQKVNGKTVKLNATSVEVQVAFQDGTAGPAHFYNILFQRDCDDQNWVVVKVSEV